MENKRIPLSQRIGEKHNMLTIRDYFSKKEHDKTKYYFLCDCDRCGRKNVKIRYENITRNISCGCIKQEQDISISYIKKQSSYLVRVKGCYIGVFASLEIAEMIRDEAYRNINRLDVWNKKEKKDYIHSLVPDYKEKTISNTKSIQYKKELNKFRVKITKNKKTYFLGSFDSLEIAQMVRNEAYRNINNMDVWMKEGRLDFIRSLVPNYNFRKRK